MLCRRPAGASLPHPRARWYAPAVRRCPLAKPFEFIIPCEWGAPPTFTPKAWLTADFGTTTVAEDAVRLSFRLWPVMSERAKIQRRIDEMNGGLAETVDVDLAIADLRRSLLAQYETAVWPAGRPKAEGEEARKAQGDAINAAWLADANSPKRIGLQQLEALRDHIRAGAEWGVLIDKPPAGWEDIATRPMPPAQLDIILRAYMIAHAEAEGAAGK